MPLVPQCPELLLFVVHNRQTSRFLSLGYSILELQGWRIRPRGILKREDAVVTDDIHQAERLFKLQFGFSRESHNEVARQRYIPSRRLNPGDALQIFVSSVKPLHGVQDPGRSALNG